MEYALMQLLRISASLIGSIIASACLTVIIICADRGALPGAITKLYNFPFGDKLGHVALFGGLAYMLETHNAQRAWRVFGHSVPIATLLLIGLVSLEELSQHWYPHRTVDLLDLLASWLGILATSGWIAYRRRRVRSD